MRGLSLYSSHLPCPLYNALSDKLHDMWSLSVGVVVAMVLMFEQFRIALVIALILVSLLVFVMMWLHAFVKNILLTPAKEGLMAKPEGNRLITKVIYRTILATKPRVN